MSASTSRLAQFLSGQKCLIVEPSQSFSSSMQACLQRMDTPTGSVTIARKFEDAKRLIIELKPKLLITEYEIERHLGLTLIEMHEKLWDEPARISMMVTRNSLDSVVAEAAEEQVDAFLLKPFSPEIFDEKLNAVLARKLNPSPYVQRINEGKQARATQQLNQALDLFLFAKPLNDKPTLACFYAGDTYGQQGDHARALLEFREGRKFQPLHYKCIVAEFEGLLYEKRYQEAFALVGPLKTNYPLTPRRLAQIFAATIFASHFQDIAEYYEHYQRLDQRSPELVKVASLALFTAGRYYLERKDMARAVDLFDKSLLTVGRNLSFLDRVISELIRAGRVREATEFLSKAQPSDIGTAEHNRLAYRLDQFHLPKDELIERGRKLVMAGEGNPEIFEIVVRLMASSGKTTLAEAVINRAVQNHPELRTRLYELLQTAQNAA